MNLYLPILLPITNVNYFNLHKDQFYVHNEYLICIDHFNLR